MMSGLRWTTISSEIRAVPLGDVSPCVSRWPPAWATMSPPQELASIAYGVRPTPRMTSTRGRRVMPRLAAATSASILVASALAARVRPSTLADRARLAADRGDARRVALVDLHPHPAHRGRAALPGLAREDDARVVRRELLHVGAERMREREDRHAAQRGEVLVVAAERLPDHDGADAEAGDGGGRKGCQSGDARRGLRRSGGKREARAGERTTRSFMRAVRLP